MIDYRRHLFDWRLDYNSGNLVDPHLRVVVDDYFHGVGYHQPWITTLDRETFTPRIRMSLVDIADGRPSLKFEDIEYVESHLSQVLTVDPRLMGRCERDHLVESLGKLTDADLKDLAFFVNLSRPRPPKAEVDAGYARRAAAGAKLDKLVGTESVEIRVVGKTHVISVTERTSGKTTETDDYQVGAIDRVIYTRCGIDLGVRITKLDIESPSATTAVVDVKNGFTEKIVVLKPVGGGRDPIKVSRKWTAELTEKSLEHAYDVTLADPDPPDAD